MIFDEATWHDPQDRPPVPEGLMDPDATNQGPVPNESPGRMVRPIFGLVLHIEQGSEAGTNNWFHNPAAQASAHFGNPKTGRLDQWVDTNDKAWAEVSGNSNWISVEHEGFSGEALTASQLENDAQLLAWLHKTEGVALQITDDPNGRGLGWHGMGGDAWGGHYQCPGQPIVAQRQAIVDRAIQIVNGIPNPQEDDLTDDQSKKLDKVAAFVDTWTQATADANKTNDQRFATLNGTVDAIKADVEAIKAKTGA